VVDAGLTRASKGDAQATATDTTAIKALFSNRNILVYTMTLFYSANAAMLPLAGQKLELQIIRNHPYTRLLPSSSDKVYSFGSQI